MWLLTGQLPWKEIGSKPPFSLEKSPNISDMGLSSKAILFIQRRALFSVSCFIFELRCASSSEVQCLSGAVSPENK